MSRCCRPSHTGADRNLTPQPPPIRLSSPVTHGRGSKRALSRIRRKHRCRPSHTGADRNPTKLTMNTGSVVARHTRARIETLYGNAHHTLGNVARHTRARIETMFRVRPSEIIKRRPSHTGADRNCGEDMTANSSPVARHTRARIETARQSHSRGRNWSPVTHGRGSKLRLATNWKLKPRVARHTRARIETVSVLHAGQRSLSPVTHGRGSKPNESFFGCHDASRPSHTGADRNVLVSTLEMARRRRPSHTGADRNDRLRITVLRPIGSPVTHGRGSKHG